ncbi:dynein light chain Tctex-type 5-A [Alosa sapidissima]|uniref:dynein light chain Tctex-type 5-A n=1 Tax=Alosa sapidissima TaxID=34773 RepID=UPI001C084C0A|nr:dynein light chain Tctex-type 5-A [Alosa sapidissima]
MQEEKQSARKQQSQNDAPRKGKGIFDAPRNGKGILDAGHRAHGCLKFSKSKDALQRQSSTSTVVQETRRRSWLARKESGVHERCPVPKTPSSGNFPNCGNNNLEASGLFQAYQPFPEQRFSTEDAKLVMKSIVEARLAGAEYSSSCSEIARDLADSVRDAAKAQLCDRYKLICFVAIGQVKDCEVTCSSRGIWSPTADTFVEYTFKNDSLFALCILYAVYQE